MWFFKSVLFALIFNSVIIQGNLKSAEKFKRSLLLENTEYIAGISAQTEKKASGDRWLGRDKGLHFVGSMISTVAVGKTSQRFFDQSAERSVKIGAGFTFALGLGKEVWDSTQKNNKFSYKDLTADILGILMGSVLLNIE